MNDNNLHESLEKLNEIDVEDELTQNNGWIVIDEDDVLDPWRDERRI